MAVRLQLRSRCFHVSRNLAGASSSGPQRNSWLTRLRGWRPWQCMRSFGAAHHCSRHGRRHALLLPGTSSVTRHLSADDYAQALLEALSLSASVLGYMYMHSYSPSLAGLPCLTTAVTRHRASPSVAFLAKRIAGVSGISLLLSGQTASQVSSFSIYDGKSISSYYSF